MDNKAVISAVTDRIKKFINTDEEISSRFRKLSYEIYSLMGIFADEFECDFFVTEKELDIGKILKLSDFTVCDAEADWFNKLLNIVTLYADLFPEKALCFFNIKEWLDDEETEIFYKHIVSQQIRVILFESAKCKVHYSKEYKVIIDENFDEFLI